MTILKQGDYNPEDLPGLMVVSEVEPSSGTLDLPYEERLDRALDAIADGYHDYDDYYEEED